MLSHIKLLFSQISHESFFGACFHRLAPQFQNFLKYLLTFAHKYYLEKSQFFHLMSCKKIWKKLDFKECNFT